MPFNLYIHMFKLPFSALDRDQLNIAKEKPHLCDEYFLYKSNRDAHPVLHLKEKVPRSLCGHHTSAEEGEQKEERTTVSYNLLTSLIKGNTTELLSQCCAMSYS